MTDIYETHNSRYEVDLSGLRYRRSPLPTGRVHVPSERLLYGEWLPLKDIPNPVKVVDAPGQDFRAPETRRKALHIMHETSTHGIMTSDIVFMALGSEV